MTELKYPLPKRTTILAYGPKTASRPSGNYYAGRTKRIRLITIHSGETGESTSAAEGMGYWFANKEASGSTHTGSDSDSICRYLADSDTPWGASGVNSDGLHHEFAGRAGQTASQWKDDYSLRTMENGAIQTAEWSIKHSIPRRWLTDAQIRDGQSRGFITHSDACRVFGGTHWDPGPNFPKSYFMERVKFHVARLEGTTPSRPPLPPPVTVSRLTVDGQLGPKTIAAMQKAAGTSVDGVISPVSMLTRWIQKNLNARGMRDGKGRSLLVDGKGLGSNVSKSYGPTNTIAAMQRSEGTTRDGILSGPPNHSELVRRIQKNINEKGSIF